MKDSLITIPHGDTASNGLLTQFYAGSHDGMNLGMMYQDVSCRCELAQADEIRVDKIVHYIVSYMYINLFLPWEAGYGDVLAYKSNTHDLEVGNLGPARRSLKN